MSDLAKYTQKHFTCLMCGECCGAWNLPVEDDLYLNLNKIDWIKDLLGKEKVDFNKIEDQFYLPKKNKICVFFDKPTKICKLHNKLGEDYKPVECLRFPFAFAKDVAGNFYMDTSFYCKAIIENTGINLCEYLKEDYISKFDVFDFPTQVAFSSNVMVEYQLNKEIEIKLIDYILVNCLNKPILEWGNVFYDFYDKLLLLESAFIANKQYFIPDDFFNGAMSLDNNRYNPKLFAAFFLRKHNFIPDFIKIYLEESNYFEPIIAERIDLSKQRDIKINNEDTIVDLLLRYLVDIPQRKVLLAHGHCIKGIIMSMITAYALVIWYSKTLALLEEKNFIEEFHVKTAIRLVERYYIGHNVKFMELFRNNRSRYIASLLTGLSG